MSTLAGSALDWYGRRRRRQLERLWQDPWSVQERALERLVATARDTEFGLAHGFRAIRSVADYQARVPVRDYGGSGRGSSARRPAKNPSRGRASVGTG